MNDKRFTIVEDDDIILIFDNKTKKKIGFNSQVLDLLNNLNETVRRQDITIQTLTLNLEKVVKETEIVQMLQNEQKKVEMLEEDVNDYHNALFDLHKKFDKLEEENEQLKKELNSFKPVMFRDVRKGTVTLYSKEISK